MWSKQRRKKEGKESSSNIAPPGKALQEDRSHPPSHPTSPQPHNPTHPHKAQPPSQPLPTQPHNPPTTNPPPSNPQPPQRALLANPNLKPSLTVPLPSAPLTENILDSLQSSAAPDGSTCSSSGGDSAAGTALSRQVCPSNSNNGSTASNPSTAQQLQKVIDAQRVQLAVTLTQLTQQLAATQQPPGRPKSPVPVGGVVLRKQTFDYANMSNKELEKAAAQQLEREYCEDTW